MKYTAKLSEALRDRCVELATPSANLDDEVTLARLAVDDALDAYADSVAKAPGNAMVKLAASQVVMSAVNHVRDLEVARSRIATGKTIDAAVAHGIIAQAMSVLDEYFGQYAPQLRAVGIDPTRLLDDVGFRMHDVAALERLPGTTRLTPDADDEARAMDATVTGDTEDTAA